MATTLMFPGVDPGVAAPDAQMRGGPQAASPRAAPPAGARGSRGHAAAPERAAGVGHAALAPRTPHVVRGAGTRTVPVGGPAAAAAAQLGGAAGAAAAGRAVVGRDRYDTARLVASRFAAQPAAAGGPATGGSATGTPTPPADVRVVGLATGQNWPDALVGAAAMGNLAGPLLLTGPDALSAPAQESMGALVKAGATTGVVFGGRDAVGETAAAAFAKAIPAAKPAAG